VLGIEDDKKGGEDIEKQLIGKRIRILQCSTALVSDMYQSADSDGNGALDPEEFEAVRVLRSVLLFHVCSQLLLRSNLGFTKEDVKVVMNAHDEVSRFFSWPN